MTKRLANPQAPWANAKADRRVLTRDPDWAADAIEKLRAACHPAQLDSADDPALQITVLTPRGAGKSTGAFVRLTKTMAQRQRARCLYIAVTKEHAADIIWEKIKGTYEKAGIEADFAEVKKTCTLLRNGSSLKLVGADDRKEIDKLRGISFDGVVIDEASVHHPQILEWLVERVVGPRLGERDGWIMLIGTPGHVLDGMFYEATRPGSPLHRAYAERESGNFEDVQSWSWSSHHWTLEEGANFVPAMAKLWERALRTKREKGWSDSHPVWMREYLGKWAADDTENVFRYRPYDDNGLELNQWDPEREGALGIAKLPEGIDDWCFVCPIDAGHADPCAVNIFALSPTDPKKMIYHVFGFEQTEFYARRLAQLLLGEGLNTDKPGGLFGAIGWPVGTVIDSDKAFIDELKNVYGIQAIQADRRRDFKFGAIELANGDFVDGRIKVLKGSKLAQQLGQLQWVTNEFGELKENKAQANHSTDCLVYGRKLIAHLFETGQIDGSEKAKRKRRQLDRSEDDPGSPQGEDWSDMLTSGNYEDEAWSG